MIALCPACNIPSPPLLPITLAPLSPPPCPCRHHTAHSHQSFAIVPIPPCSTPPYLRGCIIRCQIYSVFITYLSLTDRILCRYHRTNLQGVIIIFKIFCYNGCDKNFLKIKPINIKCYADKYTDGVECNAKNRNIRS